MDSRALIKQQQLTRKLTHHANYNKNKNLPKNDSSVKIPLKTINIQLRTYQKEAMDSS
jgi:hypothetical protein